MTEDRELLRQFVRENSQAAFGLLVERHTNWLYSVCLRRLRDPSLAEDATQAVFMALARKAPTLLNQSTLSPWLHQVAKYAAANIWRANQRRARHESEAAAMAAAPAASSPNEDWLQVEPELEPALDHLGARDRQAIVLRFYEQKTHPQIASILNISQEASQKRLSRALERLRSILAHRSKGDAVLSVSGVSALLLTNAVTPAPASVAASLAGLSVSSISPLTKTILHMMTIAKIKAAVIVTGVVFLAVAGPTAVAIHTLAAKQSAAPASAVVGNPVDPIRKASEAFARNDPAAYADLHAPGTPDEEAYAAAVQTLLSAQAKIVTAYKEKIDPQDKSPIPVSLIQLKALSDEQIQTAEFRAIDGKNADVILRDSFARTRVTLLNGQWRLQVAPTIGSLFPSDPAKAMQVLAKSYHDKADAYNAVADQIVSSAMNTPQAVSDDLGARLKKLSLAAEAALPAMVLNLPGKFTNSGFVNTGSTDQAYQGDVDPAARRVAGSTPPGHIRSLSGNVTQWSRSIWAPVAPLHGKRIRVSAWLKTRDVQNWGGVFLYARGPAGQKLVHADNTDSPLHGTTEWQERSMVVDVPNEATELTFGSFLYGTGELWSDEFQIELVGPDVPTNDDHNWQKFYDNFTPAYAVAPDPTTPHDGHPAICISASTAPQGASIQYGRRDRASEKYLGKRIRMTAWIKAQGVNIGFTPNISVRAGPELGERQIGTDGRQLMKGSTEWKQVSLFANVPLNAQQIRTGFALYGNGKLWVDIDSVKLEAVDVEPPIAAATANITMPVIFANHALLHVMPLDNAEYEVDLDPQIRRSPGSAPSGHIKSLAAKATTGACFAGIGMGTPIATDINPLLGKRIRLSAWIKARDVQNWGGARLYVLGKDKKQFAVASNSEQPIHGTTGWQQVQLVADVPKEATDIVLGPILHGIGEIWYDDFQIDVVGADVATNDDQRWQKWSQISPQYVAKLDPSEKHDGHATICLSSTTAPNGQWCSYGQNDRSPTKYLGHKVRMSAWIKSENLTGKSGIWIRMVVGANNEQIRFKELRPVIGSMGWQQYSVICDCPPETQCVSSSFVMYGKGKMWCDVEGVKYEIVD